MLLLKNLVVLSILFEEAEIKETFILLLMLFPLTFYMTKRKLYKYFDNEIASGGLPLANIFP